MKRWSIPEVAEVLGQHESKQIQMFKDLLPTINSPTPTMVELGAAEGYYSILFSSYFANKKVNHKNICLELSNVKAGFIKDNLPTAVVLHGYVGNLDKNDGDVIVETPSGLPTRYTLQQVCDLNSLTSIDYLHVDIQGGEDALMDELINSPLTRKIRYFFVSTHNDIVPNVHNKCFDVLKQFTIIVNSTNGWEKWGYGDGLIIAENINFNP